MAIINISVTIQDDAHPFDVIHALAEAGRLAGQHILAGKGCPKVDESIDLPDFIVCGSPVTAVLFRSE